jgi:tetraacyldisaccharide 4'-kinase
MRLATMLSTLKVRLEALLTRHWARPQPSGLARLLQPLSWLFNQIALQQRRNAPAAEPLPVPVLVVGNFTVGGTGKTPTVIAVVQALQAAGHRPGVISRGHGRTGAEVSAVSAHSSATSVGDEPLLIFRRTGVPLWVGLDRTQAAQALCAQHGDVNVLVSDDGLQHHALSRQAELVVFDERGAGNGLLLPAGPLRQHLPRQMASIARVLYTGGVVSTHLPGVMARRTLALAWPLQAWLNNQTAAAVPLTQLKGRRLLAVAGLSMPEKFFGMLEALGLQIQRLPLPDHFAYEQLPWPAGEVDVITTEKDAVKISPERLQQTRLWVAPLDLQLPTGLMDELLDLLHLSPASGPTL